MQYVLNEVNVPLLGQGRYTHKNLEFHDMTHGTTKNSTVVFSRDNYISMFIASPSQPVGNGGSGGERLWST